MAEPRRTEAPRAALAGAQTRVAATRVLYAVRDRGRSLSDALESIPALGHARDTPLVRELCSGVLRTLPRQEALLEALLQRPLKREDRDLEALILVGLYQLAETRVPPHAAVAATVEAAKALGKPWATGLVNALLRRYQREHRRLIAQVDHRPQVRWLFPDWLLNRLQAAWPERWRDIISASNSRAPMTLRVNCSRIARADYARRLSAAGLTARPVRHGSDALTCALTMDRPTTAASLPGFADGLVSVQDGGAQLAAELLDAQPGERVLDACSAPGGKGAHLLEHVGSELQLTALDLNPTRLEQVRATLNRLGLSARLVAGDATAPEGDWARLPYDRILLDAPCSATGVIRRHPDIKWLRRDSDIPALCALQAHMLDALWPLLRPGGTMLYATCSLLPEENEDQICRFVRRQGGVRVRPIQASWGLSRAWGRQTLPQDGGGDGFYYALLEKSGP